MFLLGIAASPRRGGNSGILLREALSGAESAGARVEEIVLNELDFSGCQECGGCEKTGECVVDDDMQMLYKKLAEADRFIVASPIFFGSLPGQLKVMIDRCQCLWVDKYVLKKPQPGKTNRKGAFICVRGMKRQDFFESARRLVKIFFAVINVSYVDDLFYPGVDEKGAILNHPTALREAFELGKRLAADGMQL